MPAVVSRWRERDSRELVQAARLFAVVFSLVVALALAAGALASAPNPAGTTNCSAFGPRWVKSYDKKAARTGNPIRILAACCRSTKKPKIHHCFVTVTMAGVKEHGCELVDIGPDGMPASIGKHASCLVRTTRQMVA
jgi:hypothetical protein